MKQTMSQTIINQDYWKLLSYIKWEENYTNYCKGGFTIPEWAHYSPREIEEEESAKEAIEERDKAVAGSGA